MVYFKLKGIHILFNLFFQFVEISDDSDSDSDSQFGEYYCDVCGLSFQRYDLMKRHSRIHVKKESQDDNSTAHSCNECGETFAEALDLLAHAESHARNLNYKYE